MSDQAHGEAAALSEYEKAQAARIAAWKAEHPPVVAELLRKVAKPVAHLAERLVPVAVARRAVDWSYQAADAAAWRKDIALRAGVGDITELRHKPLADCDRLARGVGRRAELLGTAEGALTGFGGVFTTLIDVPILFGLALRTIIRIGHCYGYPLDRKTDRAFVLGILVTALSETRERKQRMLVRLRDIEDLLLEEAQENLVTEEVASFIFQLEIFDGVPGVGAISGAILNFGAVQRVEQTARHVFQERWLHEHKKLPRIMPAVEQRRLPIAGDWAGVAGRAAYHGAYYVGFGAAFAFYATASILPRRNALGDGAVAADGAADRACTALGDGQVTVRAAPV
jgi:hypothetical protein